MGTAVKGGVALSIVLFGFCVSLADDNYGAIAYSESSGNWGTSYDYPSKEQAENAALSACKRGDCEVKVWFRNSCGALAKRDNGAVGSSWAVDSRAEAEAGAVGECEKRGSDCQILCWACTSR